MNFRKSLAKTSALLLLTLAMPMASVFAQTFVQPQQAPPNGNVPAPINVGDTSQTRTGDLTLENMLNVLGDLIVDTNGIIKSTLKVGGSVMSSGYAFDVTNDNANGPTLKSVLGALLVQIVRVQSLSHVGGDQPVCATAAGDLVLCGNTPPPPTPITITLTANPTSVASGSTSSITWSATGATSCNPLQGYGFTVANGATSGTDTTGALTNSTQNTFIISCTNGTTTETKSVFVAITPVGPVDAAFSVGLQATTPGQIYAPVSSIVLGDDYVIRYTTQGVRNSSPQCTAATYGPSGSTTPAWTGSKPGETSLNLVTSVSGVITPTIPGTYTHTLTCYEPNGTSLSDTISVVVTTAPVVGVAAPILALTSSNSTVSVGQNYTLEWETANIRNTAPKCVATTAPSTGTNWTGNKGGNSTSADVPPLSAVVTATAPGTYVHTLTCYGENGSVPQSVSDSVTVTVTANAPTISLTASAATIALGQTANLTWVGTNLSSCSASANPTFSTWSGNKPTSSSSPVTVVPTVIGTKVFTLTCVGQNGTTVTDTASINVIATTNPTLAFYYNNAGVQGDDKYVSSYSTNFTLGFTATNISRCEIYDTTGNPQSGWDSGGWLTPQNGATSMTQPNATLTLPNGTPSVTYTVTCEKLVNGQVTGTTSNMVTVNYVQPVTTTLFYRGPGASSFTQLPNNTNVATISNQTAQFNIGYAQTNATYCRRLTNPGVPGWNVSVGANINNDPSASYPLTLNGNTSVTFTYECKNGLNVWSTKSLTVNFVQPITITNVAAGSIGSAAATITATVNGATTSYLQMATTSNSVINATHQAVTLSGTSFTKQAQPLVYNTTYYYRICAAAATGPATCSPISQFTTTNPSPTFSNTAATAITMNTATLSSLVTPNGTAITSRSVQYCSNATSGCSANNIPPAATLAYLTTVPGAASTTNITGLTAGTSYYYKVCVNFDHGSGTPTLTTCDSIKSFMTTAPAVLPSSIDLSAPTWLDQNSIELEWTGQYVQNCTAMTTGGGTLISTNPNIYSGILTNLNSWNGPVPVNGTDTVIFGNLHTQAGTYLYEITCQKTGGQPGTVSDSLIVYSTWDPFDQTISLDIANNVVIAAPVFASQSATKSTSVTYTGNQGNQITHYNKTINANATVTMGNGSYLNSSFQYKLPAASTWNNGTASYAGGNLTGTVNLTNTNAAYGSHNYRFCITTTGGSVCSTPGTI